MFQHFTFLILATSFRSHTQKRGSQKTNFVSENKGNKNFKNTAAKRKH